MTRFRANTIQIPRFVIHAALERRFSYDEILCAFAIVCHPQASEDDLFQRYGFTDHDAFTRVSNAFDSQASPHSADASQAGVILTTDKHHPYVTNHELYRVATEALTRAQRDTLEPEQETRETFAQTLQDEINRRLQRPIVLPTEVVRQVGHKLGNNSQAAQALVTLMARYEGRKGAIQKIPGFMFKLLTEHDADALIYKASEDPTPIQRPTITDAVYQRTKQKLEQMEEGAA